MTISRMLVLVPFLACFGSFTWAMQGGFFRVVERTPVGVRLIQILGTVFVLLHLWAILYGSPSVTAMSIAIFLYIASFWLFWSAISANRSRPLSLAFSQDAPEHLVEKGPYRYMRHPFYTSYTLGWIAGVIGSGQGWLTLTVVVMWVIYYRAAKMEERKFGHGPLAQAYESYRKRVRMFFPCP